jgi:TIR domain/NB-ARC domain
MNDLFLSYARADDELFVRWLYEELRTDGLTIWFDRESMPSRSLTFLHEIRAAIDEADRVLVVVGPSALASDYVRAEWQHAQAADKVVIPVLRTGEPTDLPAEFRNLHAVDFRAERDRRRALVELRRVLRDPVPALGTVHGDVPALPPHFQPRPDQLSQVADALLIDLEKPVTITGPAAFVVLHGMGGIGKSVLAAAFARSTAARRSFPDGLFWTSVGESADAGLVARRLSRALPGTAGLDTIARGTSAAIRAQLAGKRALVVLDDVVRVEQLEAVSDAADVNTRFLVTARDADVIVASGSRGVELGELTEGAAARLLADWLDTAPDRLPLEARDLARECGYHPLALALNGAMLRKGASWSALIDALRAKELDYAETRLPHYPYQTVQRSLQVSLDALTRVDPDGASRFRELAALNWPEGVPEAAIARLWRHCGHLPARQAMKLLSELEQRALLRTEGRAPDRTVRIHDLQLAHLRQPPADLESLNRDVLAAYADACDGDWSRGPADGYFHNNLVVHLLASDRRDDVHRLLGQEHEGRNAWHQAKSDLGLVDRWFDDIDTASALLTEREIPERPRRIGLQVRYALMKASVQSQASAMPTTLLDLCVQHGIITFAKALSFGRAASLDEQQVDSLSRLLPLARAELRPVLETEALGIALSIKEPSRQIWALHRLVPTLSPGPASRAFAFVKSVPDDDDRSALLPELASVVPPEEIPDIDAVARRQHNALLSAETLAALARRVDEPSALLDEATRLAGVTDPWDRVRALCAVAEVADTPRREALMDRALAYIAKSDSSDDVARSLAAVARFLSSAQLKHALKLVDLIANDDGEVQAIFAIVPHLPKARREKLVTRLVELHRPRADALPWGEQHAAILSTDLPAARRAQIVPGVLPLIVRMAALPAGIFTTPRPMRQRRWQYDAALEILGSRLPDRYVPAAVDLLQRVPDAEDRAEMLGRLVPRLPRADVVAILSAECRRVLAISDTAPMARTLAACAAFAPESERSEIANESLRLMAHSAAAGYPERVIAAAAGQLPPERALALIANELDRIAAIEDPRRRDEALATLAPSLTPADVPRAVELARTTVPDHDYAALAKLAGLMADLDREAAVDEVLEAASGWVAGELPGDFRRALGDTVGWMSPRQVDVAFEIAQSVLTSADYAGMLHHLSGRLSRKQLREARTRAEHIADPSVRVSALAALASSGAFPARTQRALTGQIFRRSYSIANDGQRARALVLAASVAGADRPQVLEDALAAANSVEKDDKRATILCDLLTVLPPERALEPFGAMLEASLGRRQSGSYGGNPFYAGLGRPFLLSMLERAAPWFGTLDDPLIVSHVAQSARDVVRWWP